VKTAPGEPRPFLRWAGSKRQLVPRLRQMWSDGFERYYEPFMGSACLFFALRPRQAVLSDLNKELVDAFIQVRDHHVAVSRRLSTLKVGKDAYYHLRAVDPAHLAPVEAAARFIYLNRFSFNGLFRTNLSGQFNVPFCPTGTGRAPTLDDLARCATLLKRAVLRHGDFSESLEDVREKDFVYLDPPFAVRGRRVFREYCAGSFGPDDLIRFTLELKRLDLLGARFVVSYADCPEGRAALKDWHVVRVRTRRNIAGFSKHRRHAYELLASNVEPVAAGKEKYRE